MLSADSGCLSRRELAREAENAPFLSCMASSLSNFFLIVFFMRHLCEKSCVRHRSAHFWAPRAQRNMRTLCAHQFGASRALWRRAHQKFTERAYFLPHSSSIPTKAFGSSEHQRQTWRKARTIHGGHALNMEHTNVVGCFGVQLDCCRAWEHHKTQTSWKSHENENIEKV